MEPAKMREEIRAELVERIIPFWTGLRDTRHGGYCSLITYDLRADREAVHGCILNSRILWFFSSAYLTLRDEALLRSARHAYDYLRDTCIDRERGGVYWSIGLSAGVPAGAKVADAQPVDTTKHTYNQAFAIYALSAYYEASRDAEALALALDLYHVIEERCRDAEGYLEAFTVDWQPAGNDKLSENGVEAGRTMNTALHVLEAYTALYHALGQDAGEGELRAQVGDRLRFLLDIFATKLYHPEKHRQEVFFDRDYHTLIDLHSYGHDIESSWLVDRACEVLGDRAVRDRMAPITRALAEETYRVAFDGHSMANECERGVVNERRIWWVQAETVVGFLNAYEKAAAWGDRESAERFLTAAQNEWDFIRSHVIDRRPGSEWYAEVDADGTPIEGLPIVEPWKCPYHNGRMCLEVLARL